ncbi:hypothetical protein AtEden1_Chr5g0131821 [Arabidopsis thaliana]
MKGCPKLKGVSLNIFKLKHLGEVSFSNCGALTRVDLSGYPSGVEIMKADNADIVSEETTSSLPVSCVLNVNFTDCFNLDRKPVLHLLHQQSLIFNSMILPGEEVPSYFTYRTSDSQPFGTSSSLPIPLLPTHLFGTSSSLPIPLLPTQLSQPFFRFRVCAVVSASDGVYIKVDSRFKGRIGNRFDSFGERHRFMEIEKGIHLCIFDCRIPLYKDIVPLSQLNYDRVDMKIKIIGGWAWDSTVVLKEWGIRVLETGSSAENRLGNPNSTLPHVSQAEEGNMGYYTHVQGLVNEIENSEDSGDNNVETERSKKRMRDCHHRRTDMVIQTLCSMFVRPMKTMMDAIRLIRAKSEDKNSDIGRETDHFQECEDSNISNESNQSEESGDSDDDGIGNVTEHFEECEVTFEFLIIWL